jgi:hypothetical protein
VKLVFITSQAWDGVTIASAANADALCATAATNGALPGTYRAFLSDGSSDAATRLSHATVPYVLPTGTRIANNWADLIDGTIINGININEFGVNATAGSLCSGIAQVYTGSRANGTVFSDTCTNWTSNSSSAAGASGSWTSTTQQWSWYCGSGCDAQGALYCFQQ